MMSMPTILPSGQFYPDVLNGRANVIRANVSDIRDIHIYQQADRRKLSGNQNGARRRFPAECGILSRSRPGIGSILGGL